MDFCGNVKHDKAESCKGCMIDVNQALIFGLAEYPEVRAASRPTVYTVRQDPKICDPKSYNSCVPKESACYQRPDFIRFGLNQSRTSKAF